MARKIDTLTADQLKATLENLISSAKTIESYQDSVFYEERACASFEANAIFDALLELDAEAK